MHKKKLYLSAATLRQRPSVSDHGHSLKRKHPKGFALYQVSPLNPSNKINCYLFPLNKNDHANIHLIVLLTVAEKISSHVDIFCR